MLHIAVVQEFCTAVNRYPARTHASISRKMTTMAMGNSEHMRFVAQNIERVMEALNLRRVDVAEALGISVNKLGNWLRPDNYPDIYSMTIFCDRFGVTMDFIYRGVVFGLPKDLADGLARAKVARPAATAEAPGPARGKKTAKHKSLQASSQHS